MRLTPSIHPSLRIGQRSAIGGSRCARGLGVVELLTVLAVLVIGLAMVVVTARHVRSNSANELTRKRMRALVESAGGLISLGVDPTLPLPAAADVPAGGAVGDQQANEPRERAIADFAGRSGRHLAARLAESQADGAAGPIVGMGLGVGVVGPPELLDAWDRPIALLPRPHAAIGMAPDDGPFFVSAGPDGRFLTLADNIYSYDLPALLPGLPKSSEAATQPVPGVAGQDE